MHGQANQPSCRGGVHCTLCLVWVFEKGEFDLVMRLKRAPLFRCGGLRRVVVDALGIAERWSEDDLQGEFVVGGESSLR